MKRRPANECTHPKDRRIATMGGPGSFVCTACGFAVDTYSPEHAATPVAQHDKPRDLHLSTYDWTAACGDGGREVWHIDAGNEWDTREDAEAAIARHEARIRADERARIAKELHRMAAAEKESDQRSAGLHEAAMFVERGAK